MELKDKLGPINWQLMPTKKLDLEDIAGFLKLLPRTVDGRAIRHALEVAARQLPLARVRRPGPRARCRHRARRR